MGSEVGGVRGSDSACDSVVRVVGSGGNGERDTLGEELYFSWASFAAASASS